MIEEVCAVHSNVSRQVMFEAAQLKERSVNTSMGVLRSKQAVRMEHFNYLVELLNRPMRRQLADAPLHSGLADGGWLEHLIVQQGSWLTEISHVGHHPAPTLSSSFCSHSRC